MKRCREKDSLTRFRAPPLASLSRTSLQWTDGTCEATTNVQTLSTSGRWHPFILLPLSPSLSLITVYFFCLFEVGLACIYYFVFSGVVLVAGSLFVETIHEAVDAPSLIKLSGKTHRASGGGGLPRNESSRTAYFVGGGHGVMLAV